MNKMTKAAGLIVTLVVPVVLFLFLKEFGRNEFAIPVYFEKGVDSSNLSCNFTDQQHTIPSFELTAHTGQKIDQKVLEGNITIAEFFFTSCPTICPKMNNELIRVQEAFKDEEEIKILSFTVDPEHDTQEVLARYAEEHHANPNQWYFLTGAKKDMYELARCGYVLPVQDGDGGVDDFVHSDRFVLVDKEKRIRGFYSGTNEEEVDRLITEIKVLQQEYDK
jgi:protein SCO1